MDIRGTTIVAVKRGNVCAVAGDGQVTLSQSTIFKSTATKVRRLYDNKVVVGFAGSVADAMSLMEMFEQKLQQYAGNLSRSAVELAQMWRGDKILRRLEAMMIATDGRELLVVSGTGEVLAPDDGVTAVGSGGMYALSAARALAMNTELSAADIAEKAIRIAASVCVFTNDNITLEVVEAAEGGDAQ